MIWATLYNMRDYKGFQKQEDNISIWDQPDGVSISKPASGAVHTL